MFVRKEREAEIGRSDIRIEIIHSTIHKQPQCNTIPCYGNYQMTLSPTAPPHDADAPVDGPSPAALSGPMVVLDCFELSRYRRLRAVRLGLQKHTTVLVGANDSGKTSLLLAIQKFLAHATGHKDKGGAFSAYDLSADGWATLVKLGKEWDKPTSEVTDVAARQQQLELLLGVMPTLDVWLDARDGAWHLIRDLIPTLGWAGGKVGVRLRIEPVTTLEELDRLIVAYQEARSRIKAEPKPAAGAPQVSRRAWPVDLLDFWKKNSGWLGRVVAYKLNPTGLQAPKPTGEAQPQSLPAGARPLGENSLRHLIRVDFVPAQRGLGGEEAAAGGVTGGQARGLLSAQFVEYARKLLGRDASSADALERERQGKVATALEEAHGLLDAAINDVLEAPIKEVSTLGYPGFGDVQDIVLRTEVYAAQALRHDTAVQYRSSAAATDAQHLPEHAIGLGYQNLLSLTFQLMRFREERLSGLKTGQEPETSKIVPAVHLVLLEEPEAHLHVQVTRTFIQRAHDRLHPEDRPELSTHLIVSTHSSHLAHAVDFEHLRYLRRMPRDGDQPLPMSVVVSLAGLFGTGDSAENDTLRFVQRYLRVQHNDLLFADAVLLVEGTAERVLVPAFIERDHEQLKSRYLSILEVGGSHAHRLRPLLDILGLPILLLTGFDK